MVIAFKTLSTINKLHKSKINIKYISIFFRFNGGVRAHASSPWTFADENFEPQPCPDERIAAASDHLSVDGSDLLRRREGAADVGASADRKLYPGSRARNQDQPSEERGCVFGRIAASPSSDVIRRKNSFSEVMPTVSNVFMIKFWFKLYFLRCWAVIGDLFYRGLTSARNISDQFFNFYNLVTSKDSCFPLFPFKLSCYLSFFSKVVIRTNQLTKKYLFFLWSIFIF